MTKRTPISVPGVYLIRCDASDKVYVGRSINVNRRIVNHRWHLERGTHRNCHLQRAWNKHGAHAFAFELVLEVPNRPREIVERDLQAAEAQVLRAYPAAFNLEVPGEPALIASPETRAKLGDKARARWADPAYKERLRESHRKRHADPEWAAKRAQAISRGCLTPEARARRSAAQKAAWVLRKARA